MSDSMTRRGFVKSMGYGGVAATALAGLTAADGAEPESGAKSSPAGRLSTEKIRIGTLVQGNVPKGPGNYIRQILPHDFESFAIVFTHHLGGADLPRMAAEVKEALGDSGAVVSSLGVYGNPLADTEMARSTCNAWKQLIDAAGLFGARIVTGFAGRVVDKPVPESMPPWPASTTTIFFSPAVATVADCAGARAATRSAARSRARRSAGQPAVLSKFAWVVGKRSMTTR